MSPLPPSVYETVYRHAPAGGCLLSPTREFRLLAVNEAFLAATGRRREALLGVPLFEAFGAGAGPGDDAGVAALRASLLKVLASGETDTLAVQRYPIRVNGDAEGGGGPPRFEERFWSAVNTPILGADGALVCIAHSTIDVTELVRLRARAAPEGDPARAGAEAAMLHNAQLLQEINHALEAERVRLRHLFEHAPGFVYFTRGPGHLIDQANNAMLALAGQRPLVGKTIQAAFPEADAQGLLQLHDQVFAGGMPVILRAHPLRLRSGADGAPREHFVDLVLQPILDEHGRVLGICGQGHDITEQRRAEQALHEASRRKDEFLATLAHELRNPLAPIRTGVHILRMQPEVVRAAGRTLETMERQIAHMVRLIDDLLDVSRISVGKVELRREAVALRAVVESAVEATRPALEAGRHELRLALAEEALPLHGDPTRLAQVLGNLLHNAARYTPQGGRIELAAAREGERAVIEVRDNGIGIPREMLPRVFDLFTQVPQNRVQAQGGLGIGLTLARQLVALHGGDIEADSPGPGRGAVFRLRLPLAEPAPPPPQGAGDAGAAAATCPAVLVVDDNADAADSLAAMLELDGHVAHTAYNGADALVAARQLRPACVFCDIGMPGMDGYAVARGIRADALLRGTVLVAMTGWGSEDDRRRAREAGFDHHLTKPVDVRLLQRLLREVCERG